MINYKKYKKLNCKTCKKELNVRTDYLKTHTGFCQSCRKKEDWKREGYAKKCSDSHKGKPSGHRLPFGEASFNLLYYTYLKSAEYRGIEFSIDKDEFKRITKEVCFYCGAEPSQIMNNSSPQKQLYGDWIYNGIDRIDDDFGYVAGNVVTSCKKCNYAKQGMTTNEFINHIKKIYHYQIDTVGSRQITVK